MKTRDELIQEITTAIEAGGAANADRFDIDGIVDVLLRRLEGGDDDHNVFWHVVRDHNLEVAHERIAAGMAWLDDRYPGHVDRVDLATLDIASHDRCALAQAARTRYGLAIQDESTFSRRDRGFVTTYASGLYTRLWRQAYTYRRETAAAAND